MTSTFIQKLFAWISVFLLVWYQIVWAAEIGGFTIQVSPTPMTPWEAADMTIKAVDSQWNVVTDYNGTIIIDFEWFQDTNVYDMPSNGFYTFTAADQWAKTFSKGFVIKKAWSYVLKVYDSLSDSLVGTLPITVWSSSSSGTVALDKAIQIQEPLSWATIQSSAVNVIGLTESRKTPLQFFIDWQKIDFEAQTDDSGTFSVYLTDLTAGNHTLVVKMLDYEWKIIGESDEIPFVYSVPVTDNFLKSFTATPNWEIQVGQKVDFSASVDSTVRSIEMKVWSGTFVMDRNADGTFSKSLVIDKEWVQKVDITLVFEWWQKTPYTDRATLDVKGVDTGVGQFKVVNNAADPSKATLSWTPIGTPTSYIVRYGMAQDKLTQEVKVSTTQVEVSWLEIGKQYFFQVFAVDDTGTIVGKASDIAMIMTQWQSVAWQEPSKLTPSCTVVWLDLRTEKIGEKYFLVWDAVTWAVEYHIYKSEYEVSSVATMQKIATTTVPQFEYPFNTQAQQDEYTYYSVVATCSDGTNLQVDNVKKVHTWPVSDMLLLFFVSLMWYMLFRIYKYNY